MNGTNVLLKNRNKYNILTVLLQLSHGNFLKFNVAFLLLQTFEYLTK